MWLTRKLCRYVIPYIIVTKNVNNLGINLRNIQDTVHVNKPETV